MNIMKVEEIEAWAQSQGHEDVVKLCQAFYQQDSKIAELEQIIGEGVPGYALKLISESQTQLARMAELVTMQQEALQSVMGGKSDSLM